MKIYQSEAGDAFQRGGFWGCLRFALQQSKAQPNTPAKVYRLRPGMKTAPVIAEVFNGHLRLIPGGRRIKVSRLRHTYGKEKTVV